MREARRIPCREVPKARAAVEARRILCREMPEARAAVEARKAPCREMPWAGTMGVRAMQGTGGIIPAARSREGGRFPARHPGLQAGARILMHPARMRDSRKLLQRLTALTLTREETARGNLEGKIPCRKEVTGRKLKEKEPEETMPAMVPCRAEAVRKEPEETMPAMVPCREETV